MNQRIAIIEGVRTPIAQAGKELRRLSAVELGIHVTKEVINRSNLSPTLIDEVIFGNVSQPANAANISRVIALKSGLDISIPAYTVHRNCASGMEAISTASAKILSGEAEIILAGGTESMSNIPLLHNDKMVTLFAILNNRKMSNILKARLFLKALLGFKTHFLTPVIGLLQGLTDPVCGLLMGQTAEVLAKEFYISRAEQDEFAELSHQRAHLAQENNIFSDELHPLYTDNSFTTLLDRDRGIRVDNAPNPSDTLKGKLQRMKPYFDRKNGTVTIGNSCSINDGAAAVILMTERKAKQLKLQPLGYLKDYVYTGLEPSRMGLGPVYATSKLFKRNRTQLKDIDLIEMNEAFAAQIIANERAFASTEFAVKYLNRQKAIGEIDRAKLNVNGGAIALGHPVGMTGTRLVLHLLKELKRRKKKTGLATLCIGGGQGAAFLLERI